MFAPGKITVLNELLCTKPQSVERLPYTINMSDENKRNFATAKIGLKQKQSVKPIDLVSIVCK